MSRLRSSMRVHECPFGLFDLSSIWIHVPRRPSGCQFWQFHVLGDGKFVVRANLRVPLSIAHSWVKVLRGEEVIEKETRIGIVSFCSDFCHCLASIKLTWPYPLRPLFEGCRQVRWNKLPDQTRSRTMPNYSSFSERHPEHSEGCSSRSLMPAIDFVRAFHSGNLNGE